MLELLKWWKDKFDNHKMVFLYGKEFIDFIVISNYNEVIKFLTDSKLLGEEDLKKKPNKRIGLNNLFEMFSNPKKMRILQNLIHLLYLKIFKIILRKKKKN